MRRIGYYKEWRVTNPGRRDWEMWHAAKSRAKKSGLPFNITREDIVVPRVCPVLGIPIQRQLGSHQSDNSPSLDRVDPSRGYVKGNVMVISFRANRIKQNATVEELRRIARWMVTHANHH